MRLKHDLRYYLLTSLIRPLNIRDQHGFKLLCCSGLGEGALLLSRSSSLQRCHIAAASPLARVFESHQDLMILSLGLLGNQASSHFL